MWKQGDSVEIYGSNWERREWCKEQCSRDGSSRE